jgi:hypothetical protein
VGIPARDDFARCAEREDAPTPDPDTNLLSMDAGMPVIIPIDMPFLPPNSILIYKIYGILFLDYITPLNISNGTPLLRICFASASPEGVPQDVKGQPLPINQLKGTPPTEECSVSNVHRSK